MTIFDQNTFENAKADIDKIGESINQKKIVNPRLGGPFKSIPLVVEEAEQQASLAIEKVIENGMVRGFATEALLKAWTPDFNHARAKADDTKSIYRYDESLPINERWVNTGESELDLAKKQIVNGLNNVTGMFFNEPYYENDTAGNLYVKLKGFGNDDNSGAFYIRAANIAGVEITYNALIEQLRESFTEADFLITSPLGVERCIKLSAVTDCIVYDHVTKQIKRMNRSDITLNSNVTVMIARNYKTIGPCVEREVILAQLEEQQRTKTRYDNDATKYAVVLSSSGATYPVDMPANLKTAAAGLVSYDSANCVLYFPTDTLISRDESGTNFYSLSAQKLDISAIKATTTLIKVYYDRLESTLIAKPAGMSLTALERRTLLLLCTIRHQANSIVIHSNFEYKIDVSNHAVPAYTQRAELIMGNAGTADTVNIVSYDAINSRVTLPKEMILRFGNVSKVLDADFVIDFYNRGTSAFKVYWNVITGEIKSYLWSEAIPISERYSSVLLFTVRDRRATVLSTVKDAVHIDITVPYMIDGEPFGINLGLMRLATVYNSSNASSNVTTMPTKLNTDSGGAVVYDVATKILYVPTDTVVVTDESAQTTSSISATSVDLSTIFASTSLAKVYFEKSTKTLVPKNWSYALTAAEKKDWLLFCIIRVNANAILINATFDYKVDLSNRGVEIYDRRAEIVMGNFLTGSVNVPNYDSINSKITLPKDMILRYKANTYVLPDDFVIDFYGQGTTAFKVYWNVVTNEIKKYVWSAAIPVAEKYRSVLLFTVRDRRATSLTSIKDGVHLDFTVPYMIDYKLFGIDVSAGYVVQNTLDDTIKAIAHRGYSEEAPENTLIAYKLAKQNGFSYVECDIEFTSDNVPVLLHDDTINRTSSGTGAIKDLTLAQVKALDFGAWKNPKYAGEKIPTLEEFLKLCFKLNLHPYLEMKMYTNASSERVEMIVNLVEQCGMKGRVSYIGPYNALQFVKSFDQDARLGFVVSTAPSNWINATTALKTSSNEVFLDALYSVVDAAGVQALKEVDVATEVWTVNDKTLVDNLVDLGITGIATDILNIRDILNNS